MEKIGYGKWAVWMASIVLLGLLAVHIIAQPGFLSIACGGRTNYVDENNISWVSDTDADFIKVGQAKDIGNVSQEGYGSFLRTLRFFPKPLNKSCYQLPVLPNVTYLYRLRFAPGVYTGLPSGNNSFRCSLETLGMLSYVDVDFTRRVAVSTELGILVPSDTVTAEGILVSSGSVLYICLIRTSDSYDPFINTIELRRLLNGMYGQANPGTLLSSTFRDNVGGNSFIRYPLDIFDRIWQPHIKITNSSLVHNVSTGQFISPGNTQNFPPTAVMQTAWVTNVEDFYFTLQKNGTGYKSLLLLYFAEIEMINMVQPRHFFVTVTINGQQRSDNITIVRNYSAVELVFLCDQTNLVRFDFVKAANSYSPIINAFEHYWLIDTAQATNLQDVEALQAMKKSYHIKDWISDPCYLMPWKGIRCDNSSSSIRISEINLSGMNLIGPIEEYIGQLTALVNLSLDNNNLIGPLPNLSSLTMLERLYLQNNNLIGSIPDWLFELKNLKELSLDNNHLIGPLPNLSSLTTLEVLHLQNNSLNGSVPEWLFKLKNLKELFIQNNNFSGPIPAQPDNSPLNFQFKGNSFLCVGGCTGEIPETRNNSNKIVLGITISAGLTIALILMMGIALCWRKLNAKRRLDKEYSMVPSKLSKFRVFTGRQMLEATQHYKVQIGQGGSGSVFLGKLQGENDIAVKVLSSLHHFLNEVDVVAKVQHENLVSLVGYCSEYQHFMLVYEYMSGGSLWDNLHGHIATNSNLDWKTRLKIALDAAQGLEFLHLCDPKIIHRDVTTANILLDNNMNAKLADFGISRITVHGEGSCPTTTTAMPEGTPGYVDPEYRHTHKTEKSDIYCFGVVLLEIICGRAAGENFNLVHWVKSSMNGEEIGAEIIDKKLAGNYQMESVARVAKLALRCVDQPDNRPSMIDVVGEIKNVIDNRPSMIA